MIGRSLNSPVFRTIFRIASTVEEHGVKNMSSPCSTVLGLSDCRPHFTTRHTCASLNLFWDHHNLPTSRGRLRVRSSSWSMSTVMRSKVRLNCLNSVICLSMCLIGRHAYGSRTRCQRGRQATAIGLGMMCDSDRRVTRTWRQLAFTHMDLRTLQSDLNCCQARASMRMCICLRIRRPKLSC